jgi:hypothetical protein
MNTLFEYQYRDASNYKKFNTVIIKGELTYNDIAPFLHEEEFFIPSIVGLKDLQNLPFNEDDHIWHTIVNLQIFNSNTTLKITAKTLLENFINAQKNNWYEYEVYDKLFNCNLDYADLVTEVDDICAKCGNSYYVWKNSSGEIQCDNCGYSETK